MKARLAAPLLLLAGLGLAIVLIVAWIGARRPPARELGTIELAGTREPAADSPRAQPSLPPPAAQGVSASPERTDAGPAQELRGEVRVVLEPDRRPAPGADVYWFDAARLADPHVREELDLLGMGRDFFERNGRHFTADAAGVARVPLTRGTLQVVAATRTHFGMTAPELRAESSEPIVVVLREAFGIEVIVRSARTRQPLSDVAVEASCALFPESRVGGLTDARGTARLWPLFRDPEPRGTWYARVPGVFREAQRVAFALEPRAEPIEWTLPDSCAASVRIVGARGELCPLSGTLRIGWADEDGDPVEPARARIVDGIAKLSRVELGLTVHVQAQLDGAAEEPRTSFVLDPANRANASIDLALLRPLQLVRARFVDREGRAVLALRASCAAAVARDGAAQVEDLACTPRADGEVLFLFPGEEPREGPCTLAVEVESAGGAALGAVLHVALEPRSNESGDLGELHLAPAERLFAGRVLDARGRGVRGSRITLSVPPSPLSRALDCTTDSEGRFKLLGWAEEGSFELHAVGGGVIADATARLGDLAVELRAP